MMMNTAYILIPALPFAAFLIIALGSRWVGEASHRLAIPAVSASFILSVLACIDVYQNGARSIPLYTLITSGRLTVEAGLYVDAVTVVLLFLVTGVSSLVHVFSSRYMQADPRYARFFALIALFTSAMVMLVMGANLFMLFMFWEIMGLCSYLLISHWSRRPSACDAATKAFLVNGVADIGLAFGIYLTWATFGTLDIQAILSAAPQYADQTVNLLGWLGLEWQAPILSVIALLLFMGPIGKSAQIPLHVWLPFAMEAPTPVSALIHAATMVNAGVYLLIRMGPLYVLAPTIMTVVAIIGGVTALFAAAVALTAFDIKRILAYSTISQLGFMVLACGVGAYGAAIFHLLTHGAMKSFLFLSAGSALHNLGGTHHGEHDGDHAEHGHPSRTRVSRQQVPLYVGALIMALIPPIIIFWGPYEQLWVMSHLAQARVVFWILGPATVFFTAFYLFQGTMEIFTPTGHVDWSQGFRPGMMRPQLFSASLLLGLILITAGLAVLRLLIWSDFLIFISPAHPEGAAALARISLEGWSPANLLLGIGVAIAGWATAFYFHIFPAHPSAWWSERKKTFYVFLLNRGYFDEVYATLIVRPTLRVASWLWRVVDGGIDRAYMAAAGASAGMARSLWEGVDVWIIDRPANGLAAASLRMATGLSKFVTHNKSDEPLVTFVLLRLLVFVILLLVLAEQIEHYFLG
jgi:NADH-quinone oxidoreductase subunit L